jgi:hypothetical protein
MMSDKLLRTLANFEQWRDNKPARNSATPKHLCQQATALLSHYSKTTIVTKLRLSSDQFNRWSLVYKKSNEPPHYFVPLPQVQPLPETLSIELKFKNGNQLILSGELSEQVVAQLIEAVKS